MRSTQTALKPIICCALHLFIRVQPLTWSMNPPADQTSWLDHIHNQSAIKNKSQSKQIWHAERDEYFPPSTPAFIHVLIYCWAISQDTFLFCRYGIWHDGVPPTCHTAGTVGWALPLCSCVRTRDKPWDSHMDRIACSYSATHSAGQAMWLHTEYTIHTWWRTTQLHTDIKYMSVQIHIIPDTHTFNHKCLNPFFNTHFVAFLWKDTPLVCTGLALTALP